MSEQDFSCLSPFEFERLCRDLLSAHYSVAFQAFSSGRDRGVDLRHTASTDNIWVAQCKHFARSGYSKLLSHLRVNELPKIKAANPQRYVLATSVALTPDNVDELCTLLAPYVHSPHDILGQADLNAILRNHSQIQVAHPKLWLASAEVLKRIVQHGVFIQSVLTEDQIRRRLSLFVHTKPYTEATAFLNSKRVCILAGVPGVGKTTLAEMLVVQYLERGYELVAVQQNVSEALSLFSSKPEVRQVFLYDDFLGQISEGDKLGKNEDRALIQLAAAVQNNSHKRFILTTREYILHQAITSHEQLSRAKLGTLFKYVVRCEEYSEFEKAQILANHLFFCNVPIEHVAALCNNQTYRGIIRHPHYNPRVVEWMTQTAETDSCSASDYPRIFRDRLDNPSDLWSHAYDRQISEEARHLLLVLASFGDGICLEDLREAFDKFFVARAKKYGFAARPQCYTDALNECEGNFARIGQTDVGKVVAFHNPSVREFVNRRIANGDGNARDLLESAVFFEQIESIGRMLGSDIGAEAMKREGLANGEVVADAVLRTIESRAVGLSLSRSGRREKWSRRWKRTWERLKVCVALARAVGGTRLVSTIEQLISEALCEDGMPVGTVEEIVATVSAVSWVDGFHESTVRQWSDRLTQVLAEQAGLEDDGWDGLIAATNWLVENATESRDRQALLANVTDAIGRETNRTDWSSSDEVTTTLVSLEEIGRLLGKSFESELKQCQEALQEHPPVPEETPDDWKQPSPVGDDASIDDLFSALLP